MTLISRSFLDVNIPILSSVLQRNYTPWSSDIRAPVETTKFPNAKWAIITRELDRHAREASTRRDERNYNSTQLWFSRGVRFRDAERFIAR